MSAEPAVVPAADELVARAGAAVEAVEGMHQDAREELRRRVAADGRVSGDRLDAAQHAAHAFAWPATYVEALRQLHRWAARLAEAAAFGETERLILQIGFGEYLAQIRGGIPMSQGEMARPRRYRRRRRGAAAPTPTG